MKITKAIRIPQDLATTINEPLSPLVSRLAEDFLSNDKEFLSPTASESLRTSLYIEHTTLERIKEKAAQANISLEAAIVQLLESHVLGTPTPIPGIRRRAPRS